MAADLVSPDDSAVVLAVGMEWRAGRVEGALMECCCAEPAVRFGVAAAAQIRAGLTPPSCSFSQS